MPDFYKRLMNFGICRIICSVDFVISLAILLILIYFNIFNNFSSFSNMLNDISGASITLATIILAGFAIVISLIDNDFIRFLKELGVYENLIFLFEWNTYIALFVFGLSLFVKYIFINQIMFSFVFSSFVYLIISVIQLISFISKFGSQRAEFAKLKSESKIK